MKKLIIGIILFIISSAAVSAQSDEIMGNIYSTDIIAIVNGEPMQSYNIGGKTAVIAEDLCDKYYGFHCEYKDDERTLYVNTDGSVWKGYEEHIAEKNYPGNIVGNYYRTDIKIIFNGHEVPGYNIGGRMAVCIEDLGTPDDSPNSAYGYSKYLCQFTYNDSTRTVTLDTPKWDNVYTGDYMQYTMIDKNIFEASYDPLNDIYSTLFTVYQHDEIPSAECYILQPLYLKVNDQLIEAGICWLKDMYDLYYIDTIWDEAKLTEVINMLKNNTAKLSYDESLKLFYSDDYIVYDRYDNKDYTVLIVKSNAKIRDDSRKIVAIRKSGGYFKLRNADDTAGRTETFILGDDNVLEISIYPFAGPHGTTTLTDRIELDKMYF